MWSQHSAGVERFEGRAARGAVAGAAATALALGGLFALGGLSVLAGVALAGAAGGGPAADAFAYEER